MARTRARSKGYPLYYDVDDDVSAAERAKVEFEAEFIGTLLETRESRGMTQEELAKAVGVRQSHIARLESLKTTPQISTVFKVLTPIGYKLAIVPGEVDGMGSPED